MMLHYVIYFISETEIVLRRTRMCARKTRTHNLLQPQRQLQGQTPQQLQQLRELKQQQLLLLQQPPATVDSSTGNQE